MHNLDELLTRVNGTQYLFALGLFYGGVHKPPHHPKVYVSFQQGDFDGLYRIINVLLGDGGLSRHKAHGIADFLGKFVKHGYILYGIHLYFNCITIKLERGYRVQNITSYVFRREGKSLPGSQPKYRRYYVAFFYAGFGLAFV
jgi:hypothetical protein